MANKALTIYISGDVIRIAEMQKNNNKTVVLSNAAEITTPAGAFNDGYIVDVTAIAEAIRTAIFGRGFTAKEVIFTISSKKIASKEVDINYFKNTKRLGQVLQANSGEYFPMSGSGDYLFAYSILEDYMSEDGRKYRVSAVAAPMDLVRGYYEIAEELKVNVKSIDYFGNSVIQLLALQMQEGRTDLVLQIEKDATYVNVMRGHVLVLQRSVNYGKTAVINALMDVKKISEKDAKTLLSNESLLDQHVTADEYAQTVSYLVNGIGRAVEYHRTKNPGELLQGIKIFGEGSAIAGIEKILQRELGAPVEHFETLAGVSIKGQAALTAEEVLRYLPNIGAIIDPMNLNIGAGQKQTLIESSDLIKYLKYAFAVAFVGSAVFTGISWYQHKKVVDENTRLQAEIDKIKDIEAIKEAYEAAEREYNLVKVFEDSTHDDNEYILQFIDDLEALLPTGSRVKMINFESGDVEFELESGWHNTVKNEVADTLLKIGGLDYVSGFYIPSIEDDWRYVIVIGYDEETGEPIYLTDHYEAEDEEGEGEEEEDAADLIGAEDLEGLEDIRYPDEPEKLVEYEVGMILPDGITAIEVVRQRQVVYTAHCHIGLRGAAMLSIEEIINEEMENGGAPEAAEESNTEGGEE
ncbi:MAG: pilus assembly protein PilM [Lachnospiraceae bacterium]|nr:pilus assembly protein PilM [Lachnospiraceae bacterium]